jgi:hypothetical protein
VTFAYLMFLTALVMSAWLMSESVRAMRLREWSRIPPSLFMNMAMLYFFSMVILFVVGMIQLSGGMQGGGGNPNCMGLPVQVC